MANQVLTSTSTTFDIDAYIDALATRYQTRIDNATTTTKQNKLKTQLQNKIDKFLAKVDAFQDKVAAGKKASLNLGDGTKVTAAKGVLTGTTPTAEYNGATVAATAGAISESTARANATGGDDDSGGDTSGGESTADTTINGSSLYLTTSRDLVSGTANNDVIYAYTIDGATDLSAGDVINGNGGTDVMRLYAGGSAVTTIFANVEELEVHMVSAVQALNLNGFSGLQKVTLDSDSVDGSDLTLTNADIATVFNVEDVQNGSLISATFAASEVTGTDDTLKLIVQSAGSGTADTFSATFEGGVESAEITVSGSVNLELDASAADVTLYGSGAARITFTDQTSGIDASNLAGSLTAFVANTTTLAFTGTSGNDSLTIGGWLTSGDVINGGAGTDTLTVSNHSATTLTTSGISNIENLSLGLSGGAAGFTYSSGANFASLTLFGSANAITIQQMSGTTLTLNNASAAAVSLGYTGSVGTDVATITMATGGTTNSVRVSGADTLNLNLAASAAVAVTTLSVDSGFETIALSAGASGDATITTALVSGAITDLSLRASGHAALTVTTLDSDTTTAFDRLSVTNLTVNAVASSDVDVRTFSKFGSGLQAVTIVGAGTADIELGDIVAAKDANVDVTVTLTEAADLGSANNGFDVQIETSGTLTYSVTAASGAVVASAINAGSLGTVDSLSINVTSVGSFTGPADGVGVVAARVGTVSVAGSGSTITLGGINADNSIGAITVTHNASGSVNLGNIDASGISTISLTGGAESDVTLGTITAPNSVGVISGTFGRSSTVDVGTITITSGTVGVTGFAGVDISSLGISASFTLGTASVAGFTAGNHVGSITVSGQTESDITLEGISADGNIGAINLIVGGSGFISTAEIESVNASIGNVTITAGARGGVSVGDLIASAGTIGNITIDGGSAVTLGNIRASGTVGNIILNGSGASTGAVEFEAKVFGNVTVNTDGASLSFTATPEGALTVGAVSVDASAVTIDFGSAGGVTTISSITITGSGTNTVDVGSAAAVTNGITVTGSGMTVVDLTDLVAGTSVSLKGSSNTIIMSDQGGYVEFGANTGVDALVFTSGDMTTDTVASGALIANFQFSGTRLDKIYVGSTAGDWGLASSSAFGTRADATALSVLYVNSADMAISVASAAGDANTSVIILGTSVDAGSVTSALAWLGGADGVTSTTTATFAGSSQILLMWYNASGQNTQLHLIDVTASLTTTFTATNLQSDLLATFNDDIRLYSGSSFGSVFNIDG